MEKITKIINGVKYVLIRPFITTSFEHGGCGRFHVRANQDIFLPEERAEAFVNTGIGVYVNYGGGTTNTGMKIRNLSGKNIRFDSAAHLSVGEIQGQTKLLMSAEREGRATEFVVHMCYGPVPQRLNGTVVEPLGTLHMDASDMEILSGNSKFVDLLKQGVVQFC